MTAKDVIKEVGTPVVLLILFVGALFAVYGVSKNFVKKPSVVLVSSDEIVTDQSSVPVTGVLKNTSSLEVGGQKVEVNKDGSFSALVPVEVGDNSVDLLIGKDKVVGATILITREPAERGIISSSIATTDAGIASSGADLASSGPAEIFWGSFGLSAVIVSFMVYRQSVLKNTLQKA